MKYNYLKNIGLLGIFVGLMACHSSPVQETVEQTPIAVKISKVAVHDLKSYNYYNGTTQYLKKQSLRSGVTGYVNQLHFAVGETISNGQVFASVKTKEQQALQQVVKKDTSLQKFIHPIVINSKVSGIITAVNIAPGSYVSEGDVVATVTEPKSLVIAVSVPFDKAHEIHVGTPCQVEIGDGKRIACTITGVLPTVDPVTQTQNFLIALADASLPENIRVRVGIVEDTFTSVLTVPKKALQSDELMEDYWVMKVVHDTLAIKQVVKPEVVSDSSVAIAANLKVGDMVVTQGAYQMNDSTWVKIQQ